MLNRKPQIEEHKKTTEDRLVARMQLLKSEGAEDRVVQKDAKIKQFKAEIRKARHQLESIAALETLVRDKAAAKAEKAAAAKAPRQEPEKAARKAAPKKPKKEKKPVAPEQ